MEHGPNVSPWFWTILESADRSLTSLRTQLEGLTEDELRSFRREFDEAKDYVDPCHWAACRPHLTRGCSEDHGDDFAAWVVMQGRAFYDRIRAHPQGIAGFLAAFERGDRAGRWSDDDSAAEFRGCGRGDDLANRIHRARTGLDLEVW